MTIFRTKHRIDLDKDIGNFSIVAFRFSDLKKGKEWTEVQCCYRCDCESCPMGWESRSYEGECEDCGCLFDKDFNVPIWKCMLPNWVKKIIIRWKGGAE